MAERIHPSSKPQQLNPPPKALNAATKTPSFPANKAQLYDAARPPYRPQPKPYRLQSHRRSCCCACFLWTTFILVILAILVAIVGAGFWVLYQPQRPSFALKSLQITQFNITKQSTPKLLSKLDLTVSTRNPNKNLVFIYNPITISMKSSHGRVDVGNGSFPGFTHGTKNTTNLKALVSSGGRDLDSDSVDSLRSDLKQKNGLELEIKLKTKVKLKVGSVETERVGIKIVCKGIQVSVPKRKSDVSKMKPSGDKKCKVSLEFKIWKWSFGFIF